MIYLQHLLLVVSQPILDSMKSWAVLLRGRCVRAVGLLHLVLSRKDSGGKGWELRMLLPRSRDGSDGLLLKGQALLRWAGGQPRTQILLSCSMGQAVMMDGASNSLQGL